MTRTAITTPARHSIVRGTLAALALTAAFLVPAAQAEATATCAPHTTGVCRAGSTHPAGATAQCKDGTYSYSETFRGTCSHHGGVRYWYK
ncbi:DUF3761 domain-containing protein [Streptomyces sp. NPDC059605]|uniref:DUF3761 domain-containing protein n=1 Tax=unclassified Streptomyces TaxID=2593676 RepID=UPI0036A495F6